MTTHTAIPVDPSHPKADHSHSHEPTSHAHPAARPGLSGTVRFALFVVVLAAVGGGLYYALGREKALGVVNYLKEQVVGPPEVAPEPDLAPAKPKGPWNGMVKVTEAERKTIGFKIVPVLPQTEPIRLELPGTTDYDLNTLNKVRPRFDNALVEKVYVSAGQSIKKGEPLLDLRSAELGLAKNECRTKFVQWDHDHKYLIQREPLAKDGRITQMMWTDTQNDEKKSRLDYLVSREKLATYGMTKEQINHLLEGLSDDRQKALAVGVNVQDITHMTVVSPIDGVVVERDAVPGNFYDQANVMLTISPMDVLWVWGNVSEFDQDKVHIGQRWDILLQYSKERFEGKVESIANGVDPETHSLRIRASIPNPDKNLKARMLVRAFLKIPPLAGDTVIPRNALAVINGEYYAFVEKGGSGDDADLFERRKLEIEQENSDVVVVKKGLKPASGSSATAR